MVWRFEWGEEVAGGGRPPLWKPTSSPHSSSFPPTSRWFALYAGFRGHSLLLLSFSSSSFSPSFPPCRALSLFCPCDLELAEGNHSRAASLQAVIVCVFIFLFFRHLHSLLYIWVCANVCLCETDNTIKAGWEKKVKRQSTGGPSCAYLDSAENNVTVQTIWSRQKTRRHVIKHEMTSVCAPPVFCMHTRVRLSARVSMSNNCEAVKKHFSASPDGNVLHGCRGNLPLSAFTCSNLITRDRRFIHANKGVRRG